MISAVSANDPKEFVFHGYTLNLLNLREVLYFYRYFLL